jgi:hypothetical protein
MPRRSGSLFHEPPQSFQVCLDHPDIAIELLAGEIDLADREDDFRALRMSEDPHGFVTVVPDGSVTSWSRTPYSFHGTNRTVTVPIGESSSSTVPSRTISVSARPVARL